MRMNGVHLEEVQSFHHLDVTKDGSCAVDVRLRITAVTVGMDRLNIIWEQFNFGFTSQSSCPLCCTAARRGPCSRRRVIYGSKRLKRKASENSLVSPTGSKRRTTPPTTFSSAWRVTMSLCLLLSSDRGWYGSVMSSHTKP